MGNRLDDVSKDDDMMCNARVLINVWLSINQQVKNEPSNKIGTFWPRTYLVRDANFAGFSRHIETSPAKSLYEATLTLMLPISALIQLVRDKPREKINNQRYSTKKSAKVSSISVNTVEYEVKSPRNVNLVRDALPIIFNMSLDHSFNSSQPPP